METKDVRPKAMKRQRLQYKAETDITEIQARSKTNRGLIVQNTKFLI